MYSRFQVLSRDFSVCCACVLLAAGCRNAENLGGQDRDDGGATESQADGLTAQAILTELAEVYRQADTYVDNAQYHERYVRRDSGLENDVPSHVISVAFHRPGQVRINRQVPGIDGPGLTATVTSNGKIVRAFVSDYTGQVLEHPAPEYFSVDLLFQNEQLKQAMLPVPVENLYPQLALLLSEEDNVPSFLQSQSASRLSSKRHDGIPCYRIRITRPSEGVFVYWIDQDSFLLRRIDMPTKQVRKIMDPRGQLKELTLWIDFHDASIEHTPNEETFEMLVPEGATRVGALVAPPSPTPDWLGKLVKEATFTDLSGEPFEVAPLAGKVLVLDFWFTGCQPCRHSMPALEKLYQANRENENFAVYAISIDQPNVAAKRLVKTIADWGATMPVLRDLDDTGVQKLGITGWPTTVLIGPEGKIQQVARGAKSSYESWQAPIDALLAGEDVAAEKLISYQEALSKFETEIAAAAID